MILEDQGARREELWSLLGDLPDRDRRIVAQTVSLSEQEGYITEKLMLDLNGIELVPAYFVRPKGCGDRLPVVLYNHAHGGNYALGKDELLNGRGSLQEPAYAKALTGRGYAALAIDHWAFGERQGRTETTIFKEMLWTGQVMWGMMIYDSLRVVDYLITREDVDPNRIGTLGLSMGSTMAWWLAALDPRIKVCVDICCLTDFDALRQRQALDEHSVYYYVPSLLKHFTTAEINGLIAPRPHLSLAGDEDVLTPLEGLERIDAELKEVYARFGASDAWRLCRYPVGHREIHSMRKEALTFLEKWL